MAKKRTSRFYPIYVFLDALIYASGYVILYAFGYRGRNTLVGRPTSDLTELIETYLSTAIGFFIIFYIIQMAMGTFPFSCSKAILNYINNKKCK
jgi:hypothetical protein